MIQSKYVLPKLCHLPQYSYGSRDPTTRVPGFRDPGSVLIQGQVTQHGNPYLICITKAHNQIFNDKYYKPLEVPVYLNTIDEVNSILDKDSQWCTMEKDMHWAQCRQYIQG